MFRFVQVLFYGLALLGTVSLWAAWPMIQLSIERSDANHALVGLLQAMFVDNLQPVSRMLFATGLFAVLAVIFWPHGGKDTATEGDRAE